MSEAKRMVTGFNHNVKHRGKVYHVQTEDSGLGNPHIITHLFVGGNILASKKTSYADIVGAENLVQVVRELMEEQHKEMPRNLVNGVYDDIDQAYGERAQHFQPGELAGVEEPGAAAPAPPPPRPPPAQSGPPVLPRVRPTPPPIPAAVRPPTNPGVPAATAWARPAPPPGQKPAGGVGDDLVSEKSLDEVILSYLAEDLGEKK